MLNIFSLLQLGHTNGHSTCTACPQRTVCILAEAECSISIHSISDLKNVKMQYVVCKEYIKELKCLKKVCVYISGFARGLYTVLFIAVIFAD